MLLTREQQIKHSIRTRNRRQQYRTEKRCVQCGKQPLYSKSMCQLCYENHKKGMKRRNEYLLNRGLCRQCGKNNSTNGTQLCNSCKEKVFKAHRYAIWGWEGRIDLLRKMGGQCVLCGEDDLRVLEVDHLKLFHHRANGLSWGSISRAARISMPVRIALLKQYKNGELRLLCRNCNKREALKQIGSEIYYQQALRNMNGGKIITEKWFNVKRTNIIDQAMKLLEQASVVIEARK